MYKEDPDLTESFVDLVNDLFPDIKRESLYIHWHPSVSEYCIYIDDKWSGYVDEEYIFKAGFEIYKTWTNAWTRSNENEIYHDLIRRYIQTCVEFLKEKGNSEPSYMDSICWFIRVVRHHRVLPKDFQDNALEMVEKWCTNADFIAGAELLKQELENGMGKETHIRRSRTFRSED